MRSDTFQSFSLISSDMVSGGFSSSSPERPLSPPSSKLGFSCSKLDPWFLCETKGANKCSQVRKEGMGTKNALRSNDGDENDKGSDATKEHALHLRVVGDNLRLPVLDDRNFHLVTAYGLTLRRCRRYHLSDQKEGSFTDQFTSHIV